MSGGSVLWLGGAVIVFLAASSALRAHVGAPGGWLFLAMALALYTAGNLMMVRLMCESGMAVAISVSAVLQLVLSNAVAILAFGERPAAAQLAGIALGVAAVRWRRSARSCRRRIRCAAEFQESVFGDATRPRRAAWCSTLDHAVLLAGRLCHGHAARHRAGGRHRAFRVLDKSLLPWIIASQTIPILAIAPMIIIVSTPWRAAG
jgi:small multidrug resistance pump